jgi:hypothetical protein
VHATRETQATLGERLAAPILEEFVSLSASYLRRRRRTGRRGNAMKARVGTVGNEPIYLLRSNDFQTNLTACLTYNIYLSTFL